MTEAHKIRLNTYTNEAWTEGNVVVKIYKDNPGNTSIADPLTRLRREADALNFYRRYYQDDFFTPALISVNEDTLTLIQERIIGQSLQEKKSKDKIDIFLAGQLLRKIHVPNELPRNFVRQDYEATSKRVFSYPYLKDLLRMTGLGKLDLDVNWDEVDKMGSTRIHGDYWLEHLIIRVEDKRPFVVDWDHAQPGTPYRDFAFVQMWILDTFGMEQAFWEGYGHKPHKPSLNAFVRLQSLRLLTHVTPTAFVQEAPDGFFHKLINTLKIR